MSPTGGRQAREPNLPDIGSPAGIVQQVYPYTPDLSVAEQESAAQSLLRRLRLPITLACILKNQLQGEQLSQEMRSAVSQRSAMEQQRLRSFAQSLRCTCDDILGRAPFLENDKIDTSCEPARERKDQDNGSSTDEQGKVNATMQPDVQHNDKQSPHREDTHAEERSRLNSDAICTASFLPGNRVRGTRGRVKASSKSTAMPLPAASSPEVQPSIEPMTPERTPSRASRTNLASPTTKDTCSSGCLYLLHQVTDDFVRDSYGDVQLFHLLENDLSTYKAVLDSLTNQVDYMNQEEKDRVLWSDGSQWHESQARLVRSATRSEKAAQDVSARILRSRLGPRDEVSCSEWERSRKNLNTHLARGRKWSRLVEELGSGILFKNTWKLAKSSQQELDILIRELPKDATKTTILRLLTDQMTILLQTGRTDPDEFRKHLGAEGLSSLSLPPHHMYGKRNDDIYTLVRRCIDSDRIHIKGTGFEFGVESLRKFTGDEWLNDETILACLHLSDKLPFVRVGSCIPIHSETKLSIMPRPFEKAGKQMTTWHDSERRVDRHIPTASTQHALQSP
ncbi:hypothetical protein H9Q70_004737 [Fusarium xylarioides]|nr:hypothetical protein H9Q70_004737 [Fusarium xylarioides]